MRQGTIIYSFARGLVAAALMIGLSTPSAAAPYTFQNTVNSTCTIAGPSGIISMDPLVDANGHYTPGISKDSTDTGANCNQGATKATITHTNLFTSTTVTGGSNLVNVIPMSASLTTTQGATLADGTTASGTGTSSGTGPTTIGAFTGLKVTATLGSIGTSEPVRSGANNYGGTITITLQPAS
jgi:hypothetical protein